VFWHFSFDDPLQHKPQFEGRIKAAFNHGGDGKYLLDHSNEAVYLTGKVTEWQRKEKDGIDIKIFWQEAVKEVFSILVLLTIHYHWVWNNGVQNVGYLVVWSVAPYHQHRATVYTLFMLRDTPFVG
jgi:hypothetical protein